MRAIDTQPALSIEKKSHIRWKHVVFAAFLSEIAVIALLSAVTAIYRLVIAPGQPDTQYQEFAQLAGYYLAAPSAAVATFVFALRVARRLEAAFIANGLLVGAVSTLLTLGFIFGAKPEHRLMYIVSYVLRIAAGCCGGWVAQKMKGASHDYSRQVR